MRSCRGIALRLENAVSLYKSSSSQARVGRRSLPGEATTKDAEVSAGSDRSPIHLETQAIKKPPEGGLFIALVEAAGIEPASKSPTPSVLHA